ncbi:MAG: hypothetical protein HY704_06515 [Gemmatimonadetes bacterium]|nr:hypothetical protein [Gemmatimonadota bacterium]
MSHRLEGEVRVAKPNDKVMALVERELVANPKISVPELMEKAKKVDPAVARMNARQFNARYPLQIKRRRGRKAGGAGVRGRRRAARIAVPGRPRRPGRVVAPRGRSEAADRDGIRRVFLRFAKDLARAEGKPEIVDLIGGVDGRVDEILRLAGGR